MTTLRSARRREAEDLQALLSGGRPSTPEARQELAPLVALARGLSSPAPHVPAQDFRAALRERLVAEAADRVPAAAVPAPRPRPAVPARLRRAVAAVAVASVVAGTGAAAASTRSLPGDSLYGLKRQIESVELSLARGDVGHGRELLDQADARLSEAEALSSGEHAGDPATQALVGQALRDLQSDVTLGSADLTQAYQVTGDAEPMELLQRFVTEQRERLADLLPLLDPSLRARARALADQLAGLDQQVDSLLANSGSALPGSTLSGTAAAATGAAGTADALARDSGFLDAGLSEGLGSTGAARAARAAGGVSAVAGDSSDGRSAASEADGVTATVDAVTGAVTGASSGGGTSSGGATGGGSGTVGGLVGSGSSASAPGLPTLAPSAVPTPLPALPVPVPTSSAQGESPVSTVTSAVPLPSATAVPTVRACLPVPPLTTC